MSIDTVRNNRNTRCDQNSNNEVDAESDEADPCFPYTDGPGHRMASPETLSIIWQQMKIVGMKSFRPDLSQPFNTPENQVWWDFAIKTLCKLVECGEYDTISLELCTRAQIWETLRNHVTETLMKRYVLPFGRSNMSSSY